MNLMRKGGQTIQPPENCFFFNTINTARFFLSIRNSCAVNAPTVLRSAQYILWYCRVLSFFPSISEASSMILNGSFWNRWKETQNKRIARPLEWVSITFGRQFAIKSAPFNSGGRTIKFDKMLHGHSCNVVGCWTITVSRFLNRMAEIHQTLTLSV